MTGPFPPIEPVGPPDQERRLRDTLSRARQLRRRRTAIGAVTAAVVAAAVAVPLSLTGGPGKPASLQTGRPPASTSVPLPLPTTTVAVPATTTATTAPPTTATTAPVPTTTLGPSAVATWTSRAVPAGVTGGIEDVACPSARECFAVSGSSSGQAADIIISSSDGGATWHVVYRVPSGDLQSVSCPSVSMCVAVGSSSAAGPDTSRAFAIMTRDGGSSWDALGLPSDLDYAVGSVSCPTTSECLMVGIASGAGADAGSTSHDVIVRTTDGGAAWTETDLPAGMASANSVTCFAARCILAGATAGPTASSKALSSLSTDGGTTWQPVVPAGTVSLGMVSCSGRTCVGADGTDGTDTYGIGEVVLSHDGGASWTALPSVAANWASCTPEVCVLVGARYSDADNAFTSTAYVSLDGGSTWKASDPPDSPGLSAVSCPTSPECVAVGALSSPDIFTLRP